LVCDNLIAENHPKAGTVNSLSIFTYNEADRVYRHFGIDKEGQPMAPVTTVNGQVWTFLNVSFPSLCPIFP
jgi:hypothetical protein